MKNMKKTLSILLGAAILAGAAALPKLVRADDLRIHAGGVGVDINDGHHRDHERHWLRHEEMDAALTQLREARGHLERGGHEFGGHRAKAIRIVDKAIAEIMASVDYANSHER